MRIGKHWELLAFRRCKLIGYRFGFTRTPMHVSGGHYCDNPLIHVTVFARAWYLSLWFFTLVLEYCRREPSRVNGVPQ